MWAAFRRILLDPPAAWLRRQSPAGRDAVLYALAATFAGLTIVVAGIALYRAWGEMAVGPYAGAAVVAFGTSWWQRRRQRAGAPPSRRVIVGLRLGAFGIALIGATLAPLTMEVIWRSEGNAAAHVQPEVLVVERAGVRVAAGQDPYRVIDRNGHILIHQSAEPVYELYYPYLPGMVIFGFSSGSKVEAQLTDARIQFLIVTFAVAAFALWRLKAPADRRVRSWQVLTALPTAALPLATGGDDMPVVALMLLGLVGLQRRRPYLAGLALGAASSLKFTAWPLAFLALWAALDRGGRRAAAWTAAGIVTVVVPVVVPFAASNPSAFVDNVIRFPLGLAGVAS
ncbi:MAG: glycosyltransferase 87 family protein, partial [Actinomycetota bacterium]|nr:glycosyltransferase 87 family protein [Actinomycetota bacterium]